MPPSCINEGRVARRPAPRNTHRAQVPPRTTPPNMRQAAGPPRRASGPRSRRLPGLEAELARLPDRQSIRPAPHERGRDAFPHRRQLPIGRMRAGEVLARVDPEVDDGRETIGPPEQRFRDERQEVAAVIDVQPRDGETRRVGLVVRQRRDRIERVEQRRLGAHRHTCLDRGFGPGRDEIDECDAAKREPDGDDRSATGSLRGFRELGSQHVLDRVAMFLVTDHVRQHLGADGVEQHLPPPFEVVRDEPEDRGPTHAPGDVRQRDRRRPRAAIERLAPVAQSQAGSSPPFGCDDPDIPAAAPHLVLDPGHVPCQALGRLVGAMDEEQHPAGRRRWRGWARARRAGRRHVPGVASRPSRETDQVVPDVSVAGPTSAYGDAAMTTETRRSKLLLAAFAMTAIVAACSSSGGGSATTAPSAAAPSASASEAAPSASASLEASASASAAAAGAIKLTLATGALGTFIADGTGKTLYMFTPDDGQAAPTCNDQCAANWPALTASSASDVTVGDGLDQSKVKLETRADGTQQVVYGDYPLYYFAKDSAAGETNGQ